MLKNFGLLGQKLAHSFSKDFFKKKFLEENISAQYSNFEIDNLTKFKDIFKDQIISGLNVTIPYKNKVIQYLDSLDPISHEINAVNTILPFYKHNKLTHLKGYNTDVYGFHQMIKPYLKSHHERALVFGTGGASAAVAYVLKGYNIDINFISRFANSNDRNIFTWDDVNEYMLDHHLLIINTTPIGMFPNNDQKINIPFDSISKHHLVIDLIYNPVETYFLKRAKKNSAQILNGYSMLVNQALKAWEIWNT